VISVTNEASKVLYGVQIPVGPGELDGNPNGKEEGPALSQAANSSADTLKEVVDQIKKHIHFNDQRFYTLLALWILGTHMYTSFQHYPYLYVTGTKGSGKSKLGEVISLLSRNGLKTSDLSQAYFYRTIDKERPTLILDELEDASPELRKLLRTYYKMGTDRVGRMRGTGDSNYVPDSFDAYCPKAIINIRGLDDLLQDRSIEIVMERVKGKPPIDFKSEEWHSLNGKIAVHMDAHKQEIESLYAKIFNTLDEREEELWGSIRAVSQHFQADQAILPLKDELLETKRDEDESPDGILVEVLVRVVNKKDWYSVKAILFRLREYDGDFNGWNETRLARMLRRVLPGAKRTRDGKGTSYWLEPESVTRKAKDMGLPTTSKSP